LNDHRDEILNQPAKTRAQYAFEKINADLNLNLKYEAVYQLLYRSKLLGHNESKVNPYYYYLNQLIEQLKVVNSSKKTKKCIDKLLELYASQVNK
jgi:hypothetical protein